MQKKRNIRLLAILAFLTVSTALLMTLGNNGSKTIFDEKLFAVQDTAQIERIVIAAKGYTNELKKENSQWMVNGKYRLDEGLRRTLLPVLKEIRVRRSVAESNKSGVIELLNKEGVKVDIYNSKGLITSFRSAGIVDEGLTYFVKSDKEQPYVVHLPGYESYVAGLFEITENDWRERIVMHINWHSLTEMKLEYTGAPENNFSIKAGGNFFNVPGVQNMDTSKVFDYLQEVQYVLTDKYLNTGEMPLYDSISQTTPFAMLSMSSIGKASHETLSFFQRQQNDRYMLGKTDNDQLALFEYNRIKNLFAKLKDFER